MSSNSYVDICPKCKGSINIGQESKPYDHITGECLNCGFTYYNQESQMTLEEVNDIRVDSGMKPLKKLVIQKEI